MRPEPDQISFVPVEPRHYALLKKWLNEPHIRQWWGDPEQEFAFIRDMVEGRDSTRPFLIAVDGEPVGYIQCWSLGDHQNAQWLSDNPWLLAFPPEAVGVDLSIGDAERLSQGLGSAALTAFVGMLRREGHSTIIIDPDMKNDRAVAAYRRAGFRPVPSLEGRTDDALIMHYAPNANETT
jgi:RimJ/RimL family protein N-acetyltransferase